MNKQGILLINMGTPASPTTGDVKKYLRIFLSDRRVIKNNGLIWKMVLHGIILRRRPPVVAKKYEGIWTKYGSPLLVYARATQANLQKILPEAVVKIAMTYSEPFIPNALDAMLAENVDKLTIIPMFPQYSGTTTGSIFDIVMSYFSKTDKIINLNFVASFHNHPSYIKYFANRLNETLKEQGDTEGIVFSYHNIPEEYVEDGDRYPRECEETTRLIMEQVGGEIPHYLCYQSVFGRAKWLDPKTEEFVPNLPKNGVKNLLVVAPGFVADCLETILEIEKDLKQAFLEAGGEKFIYLPTFNGDPQLAEILKEVL